MQFFVYFLGTLSALQRFDFAINFLTYGDDRRRGALVLPSPNVVGEGRISATFPYSGRGR